MKNKIMIAALILVSVLLIISVIGLVHYKSAFEDAQASAVKWHSLSDQYLVELKEANRELDTANRTIYEQDVQIAVLGETCYKLETRLTSANSKIDSLTFHLGDDMLVKPGLGHYLLPWNFLDCDDSALYMYLYFTNKGYEVRMITGNLDLVNESRYQCNHVWVLVKPSIWAHESGEFAYDWGYCYHDDQHKEGYIITYKELLRAALYDQ